MKNISVALRENQEKTIPLVWTRGSGEISIEAKLVGRGAKLNLVGAFFLANKDEVKLNVNIEHVAPDTTSETLIKSVLTDKAVGSFYGLVSIKKGAKIVGAEIGDLPVTILGLLGIPIPGNMSGRFLKDILNTPSEVKYTADKEVNKKAADLQDMRVYTKEEEEAITKQLRNLGYID